MFGAMVGNPDFIFASLALLINLLVAPHRGVRNNKAGWVTMCLMGNFRGGNLFVKELKLCIHLHEIAAPDAFYCTFYK